VGKPALLEAYEQARLILEKLVKEFPDNPNFRKDLALVNANLGATLHKAGKLKEAEPHVRESLALYQKLVDEFPGIPDYLFELARTFGNLGLLLAATQRDGEAVKAHRQAITRYEKVTAAVPERVDYRDMMLGNYFSLCQLLDRIEQYQEAEKLLREALNLHPGTPNLENQLAWLLANCGDPKMRRPAEAVELAKKLVREHDKAADPRRTLGVAHYRAGNYVEAVDALETSIKLEPPFDPVAWLFLSMAESKLGHPAKAQKWYDQAAEWMEKNKNLVKSNRTASRLLPSMQAEAKQTLEAGPKKG
jgi:tetratricopeptide (TPR) repeat protein